MIPCDRRANALSIRYLRDSDPPDRVDPGRVVFFDLVEIERCGPDRRYPGSPCAVAGLREKVVPRRLGGDSFSIAFRPLPFNQDLQGSCGEMVSGTVSIRKNGEPFQAGVAFDESHDCVSSEVKVLSKLVVHPRDRKASLTHRLRAP